ncbi:MAG TPA: hypothetical protein VF342_08920 [Alphaproteobacteria bacterium]
MAVVPFGEWLPDMPAHGNPGLVVCRNVISRTPDSYGPFAALAAYSGALGARCQGAFAARDADGNVTLFAGDAARLYRLTSASTAWSDVSRTGGYAVPADDRIGFVQYGSRLIAAMGLSDPLQSFVLGASGSFADLAPTAPRARHIAVVRDFVVVANTYDAVDGNQPQRVWWSAIDDPTGWPAPGTSAAATVQSDYQDLAGDGGWNQGIVGALNTADGVAFQERGIWRMTYVGAPLIFQFDRVEGARGTPAPGSIVQLGGTVAYLGEDGFYLFDGSRSIPIGANKIDKTFFADLDQTYFARISAAVDPINKIFYWAYPGAGNVSGHPNRLLAYNWSTARWSLIALDMALIFRAGSFGYNLDGADALGLTVDDAPFGPDSRFWTGGRALLAAFDVEHRLNFFTGPNLGATFETGDLDLGAGRRVFVSGLRPIVDGGAVTACVGHRDAPDASVSYTAATEAAADGFCPQRIATRFARARIEIAPAGAWSHAKGVEPRLMPEGTR